MGLMSELEFADKFSDLAIDLAKWSQATFGSDAERGPMGALKHLEKEAKECQEAVGTPQFVVELADCLILLIDASRRAGVKPMQLVEAALNKMEVNKQRSWPKAQLMADWIFEPACHIEQEDPNAVPMKYWRVFARCGHRTVVGYGDNEQSALQACREQVQKRVDVPVEHVRS